MRAAVRSTFAVLLVVVAEAAAAAQGRYRITLALSPGDVVTEVARQIEAISRGRVESVLEEGSESFVLIASDAAMRTIASYPHVARVETLGGVGVEGSPATWTTGRYEYDGSGNIKSITRTNFTEQYVYDAFGRLTSGTAGAGRTQSYTYDRFGNILTITTDGSEIRLGVDSSTNRMNATGASYNVTATYDAAGRMTEVPSLGYKFSYDGLDTMTESTVGQRKIHLYTANDERVASVSIVNGAASTWDWTIRDPSGKVLRRFTKPMAGTLTWTEDYVYRDSQMLAADVAAPERRRHFHPDHLGTPRLITGNGGVQIGLHTYFPFGMETTFPQEGEAKKFTGHERDSSALDYMHARYYGVGWGRFLSVDPVLDINEALHEPQLWNRYSYVTNNPLKFTDPDGRYRTFYKEKPLSEANDWNKHPSVSWAFNAQIGLLSLATPGPEDLLLVSFAGWAARTVSIRMALHSASAATRLEGRMARALGSAVTEFKKAFTAAGKSGEIDVGTAKAVVEVTIGDGKGKLAQLNKLKEVAGGREVIIVGANIGKHAAAEIQKAGYKLFRTVEDAARYVRELK